MHGSDPDDGFGGLGPAAGRVLRWVPTWALLVVVGAWLLPTVGALIGYRTQTIEVYRPQREPVILHNGDRFTVPELLPGWEMEVSSIWAPEFDEQ